MYILKDTYNNCEISRHRTLEQVINSRDKHARKVMKTDDQGHLISYSVVKDNGEPVSEEDIVQAQCRVWIKGK